MPMCRSTVWIRRFAAGISSFECTIFSTASTIPSLTRSPIAVLRAARQRATDPTHKRTHPEFSTALFAYSTCAGCKA
jgi:hypothetical protein